jgi:hypothetical protein
VKSCSIKIVLVFLFFISLSSIGLGQSGIITTVAGNGEDGYSGSSGYATSVMLSGPRGVTVDTLGNIYFSDAGNYRICKITSDGLLTTIAGKGYSGFSGDGGLATRAELYSPDATAIDSLGNLYIAERGIHRIRRITAAGIINTVVGNGSTDFAGDGGPATGAGLFNPQSVAVDTAGNLYIADSGHNRIRKVTTAGIISTIAGNGTVGWDGDGGLATSAQLNNPQGVAVDAAGNLYIADYSNNRIRKVNTAGIISTIAGTGGIGFSGDGGLATAAEILNPQSVWIDAAGNIFFSDYGNDRIRKISTNGIINTMVGTGTLGFSGDGGAATAANIYYPLDVTMDMDGNLFFSDVGNNRIRKVSGPGAVTTYFAQVAVGSGYSTTFTVTNTGSGPASADLVLADSEGVPLTVIGEVSNAGGDPLTLTDSTFPILVPSGGVSLVKITGLSPDDPTKIGWARLVSTGGSLTAVAAYEYVIDEAIQTMVGVLQSQRIQYATIPVDNSAAQSKQLAYAIANPSGQSITVKLALVSQSGNVIDDTITVDLGPKEHISRYLWQDIGNDDFRGSIVLRGQNGVAFVVLALLEKQGMYTAIPIAAEKAPDIPN